MIHHMLRSLFCFSDSILDVTFFAWLRLVNVSVADYLVGWLAECVLRVHHIAHVVLGQSGDRVVRQLVAETVCQVFSRTTFFAYRRRWYTLAQHLCLSWLDRTFEQRITSFYIVVLLTIRYRHNLNIELVCRDWFCWCDYVGGDALPYFIVFVHWHQSTLLLLGLVH